MAIASLVLGILSLALVIAPPGFQLAGILLAVIGLITAGKNKNSEQASIAKAGKVCSILGLIFCCITVLVLVLAASLLSAFISTGILGDLGELIREITNNLA